MPQVYIGEDTTDGDQLAVGEGIPSRLLGTVVPGSGSLTGTGNLRLAFFTARKQQSTAQVRMLSGGTAAGATPTICRIGLYTFDRDSQNVLKGTLVASTPNDTALFAAANTTYTKSWSTAYVVQPGQRYALGLLVVTGATAPTMVGRSFLSTDEASAAPRLSGVLAAQADLPATFLDSALAASGSTPYGVLLP